MYRRRDGGWPSNDRPFVQDLKAAEDQFALAVGKVLWVATGKQKSARTAAASVAGSVSGEKRRESATATKTKVAATLARLPASVPKRKLAGMVAGELGLKVPYVREIIAGMRLVSRGVQREPASS